MEKEENSLQHESWSEAPSYCHEDIYKAYKLLITSVADDLHDEDVSKIVFVQDLPQNQNWKALDVMQCLEKRGKFSCYEIEPLEQLLRDANRCDLVTKYVTEYKRLYGGVASAEGNSQSHCPLTHATLAPPQPSPRASRMRHSLPVRGRASMASHSSTIHQVVPEEESEQHTGSLHKTSTHSLPAAVSLATRCCTDQLNNTSQTGQQLHSFQHPSNPYPRASTPPPSLPSRTLTPAIEMNLSTARSDLQLHQQGFPASGELAAAASEHRPLRQVASYPMTNSTSASVHSSDIRPLPAEQFDGGCQQLSINHEPAARGPSTASSSATEHSYLVKRKELYTIICEHRKSKFIRLNPRLDLNAGCRASPQVGLKIYPYGLDSDSGMYATLEADIYIPRKCPLLTVHTSNVKLIVRVIDDQTGENLNGDRVLMEECKLSGKTFRIPRLLRHDSITQSKSLVLGVQATAELKFRPDEQAKKFELKEAEEEYCEITGKGESDL